MENGRVGFKARDVADLLTLYGVTSEQARAAMLQLAQRASTPGWWATYSDILPGWFEAYVGLEAAASVIRTFELQFVHGLFQTEDYARAVIMLGPQAAPAWEIDNRVALRMKRQDLLTGADPPKVWSVMDETALRRPVGGPQVMRAQLHHLAEIAQLPQVTVQVVPFPPRLRRARPARRGLPRAAHQRPLPRSARRRRPLPARHEPPQRRRSHPRRHRTVHQTDHLPDLARPQLVVLPAAEGALGQDRSRIASKVGGSARLAPHQSSASAASLRLISWGAASPRAA
jgi:hypothetical protein